MTSQVPARAELLHATAVIVGDRGVLITGPSGAGKSSIARALVDRANARGSFAALVSDDQCQLRALSGRLVCEAPTSLQAGLEVRGSGLHAVDHEAAAIIHLAVELVGAASAIRFAGDDRVQLQGVAIQRLRLPEREVEAACRAIEARLFDPPWKKFLS
ncbi:MAG: HPr kinase/phosphorylase [Phyllobacterium sp.]|uniref:HPr kinase/phosphorylase n=1 Tax=Phyllobacterium sp. TaxID=1871046 RepID=UPI0030EFFF3F